MRQGCFIIATFMISCSIRKFYQIQKLSDQQETRKPYKLIIHACIMIVAYYIRRITLLSSQSEGISSTQLLERESSSCLSLPPFHHFLPALPSSGHGSMHVLRVVASLSLYEEASRMAQVACPQKDAHCLQISSASDLCPIYPPTMNKQKLSIFLL